MRYLRNQSRLACGIRFFSKSADFHISRSRFDYIYTNEPSSRRTRRSPVVDIFSKGEQRDFTRLYLTLTGLAEERERGRKRKEHGARKRRNLRVRGSSTIHVRASVPIRPAIVRLFADREPLNVTHEESRIYIYIRTYTYITSVGRPSMTT